MSIYKGVYVSDCGKSFPNTILQTYTYNISTRIKSDTAYSFDNQYLPNVFKQNTEQAGIGCRLDVLKLRFAQLWLNDNEYLAVELPFKPSSTDFNSFFIELAFFGLQTTLGLSGETMNSGYLSLFLK